MTARQLAIGATCCLAALLVGGAAWSDATARVCSEPERVDLFLTAPPDAYVRERHVLPLQQGENSIAFVWHRTAVDPAAVRLLPADSAQGPTVLERVLDPTSKEQVLFKLRAAADGPTPVILSYKLRNVAWRPEYIGRLDPDRNMLDLQAHALITNRSGTIIKGAHLYLEAQPGRAEEIVLPAGELQIDETAELPLRHYRQVSIRERLVIDTARFADRVAREYVWQNDEASGLGDEPLLPGKIRLVSGSAGPGEVLVAEDLLPATPIGEEVEILAGFVEELTVRRRQLRAKLINIRKDKKGALAVYDLDQEVELEIENRGAQELPLEIVEHIDGYWVLRDCTHHSKRPDATRLEMTARAAPGKTTRVRWRIERRNMAP